MDQVSSAIYLHSLIDFYNMMVILTNNHWRISRDRYRLAVDWGFPSDIKVLADGPSAGLNQLAGG
jgi:hypothetical protein|tara:strand:+ start:11606 stop:11800 length:195 start_codon:yes stop_codon:yes gene_type:complete